MPLVCACRPSKTTEDSFMPQWNHFVRRVDKHVGSRVRMRRMMLSMSQAKLGDALGLTFQQVQKYEKGTNRIGASRLQHLAGILQVPVEFFFEGAPSSPGEVVAVALANKMARTAWALPSRARSVAMLDEVSTRLRGIPGCPKGQYRAD
jgi:transcriptional regulator with XRE-family HTH domain